MNEIDIKNIRIIKSIKELKDKLIKDGGSYSMEELEGLEIKTLELLEDKWEKEKDSYYSMRIKELTKKIFNYSYDSSDNLLIISILVPNAWQPGEYNECCCPGLYISDFVFENGEYNKWAQTVNVSCPDDNLNSLMDELGRIVKELEPVERWRDCIDLGYINNFWSGYLGITRDFEIVAFVSDGGNMAPHYINKPFSIIKL